MQLLAAYFSIEGPPTKALNLAVLRVSLIATLLMDFLSRLPYTNFLYPGKAIFGAAVTDSLTPSIARIGDIQLYAVSGLAVFCLLALFGIGRRASIVILFLIVTYIQEKNHFVLNGGDLYLRLLLFYLCFANSFAVLSLSKSSGRDSDLQDTVNNLVVITIMLQLFIVYVASGVAKIQTVQWQKGEAFYYVVAAWGYGGDWLFRIITQFPIVSKLLSYGTMGFELGFPIMVMIRPCRRLILVIGCLFHLGIAVVMNLFVFQAYFILSYIVFVDSARIGRLLQSLHERFSTGTDIDILGCESSRLRRRTRRGRSVAAKRPLCCQTEFSSRVGLMPSRRSCAD